MFDCLMPCLPRARERRLQHQERAERLKKREADLDVRERRLLELEAKERQYYQARAAETTRGAIQSLGSALGAWGGRGVRGSREARGGDALMEARRLLERSCAKSAAKALITIDDVAKSCDTNAEPVVKEAERAVRDVVVMRCRSQDDPEDRFALLDNLEKAFGGPLPEELQAKLSLAFFKIVKRERRLRGARGF